MSPEDFYRFYRAVHGYEPFHWQSTLARQVMSEGRWPAVLKLPTSSGKTSVIDIAVFHLALEAGLPAAARNARLRTFFIVDRRIVVDEAAEHARELAKKLRNPESEEIIRAVAEGLKQFGAPYPLQVSVLRGGMYRDATWADMPNQPLVCLSTVDQVGSRLLFRGYQISAEQAPVHAGLVAHDSMLIIDEAHLSTPFVETVQAIANKYQEWAEAKVGPPLLCLQMSATAATSEKPFKLDYDEESDVLKRRLDASKIAALREAGRFEEDALKHARALAGKPAANVVGIVVNTVASARRIFQQFKDGEAILLTGRIRPLDRDRILKEYWDRIRAGRIRTEEKLFVVATQTVEVGANIDFDSLVTEAAPLNSLQQRFGRLDRLGELGSSHAVILLRKESKPNPIYGEALQETWKWLNQHATADQIDFGVRALEALQPRPAGLNNTGERAPLLFPAHLETLVQTNPVPDPDPDVAPFLHGRKALEAADIQIVWRGDLNESNKDSWIDIVCLAPPLVTEALPVPVVAVRRWLARQAEVPVADLEGINIVFEDEPVKKQPRSVLTWRGPEKSNVSSAVRPGDNIIVPAAYGGADGWGWLPGAEGIVPDIGNDCSVAAAATGWRRAHLRIHPNVPLPENLDRQAPMENLKKYFDAGDPDERNREALQDIKRELEHLHPGINSSHKEYDTGRGLTFTWKLKRESNLPSLEITPDETDDTDEASLTGRVPIRKHMEGVTTHATRFAAKCGLPRPLVEDLTLAASLHDLGKWDSRFQVGVLGNLSGEILAKSDKNKPEDYRRILEEQRYPKDARHEVTSVSLLLTDSHLLDSAHDRDLVLHLIGTHHGHGRPFTPVWSADTADFSVSAQHNGTQLTSSSGYEQAQLGSGWTERFWLLNQRYGFWGLAYLEAILRRADCVQSRREEQEK